jgi:Holliday junction DNA helicase, RuvA subunit
MIARLEGIVYSRAADYVVLDVAGVGYRVFMSALALEGMPTIGERVALGIHTHVREDALNLFGFLDQDERTAFEALIGMSGFGPRAALQVLSGIATRELAGAVCAGDIGRLCLVPGVGKKKAERMILELKDRLLPLAQAPEGPAGAVATTLDDLRSALTNLGFKGPEVERTLSALKQPALSGSNLEQLMPQALRLLRS